MKFYGILAADLLLKANKQAGSVLHPQPLKSTFSFII